MNPVVVVVKMKIFGQNRTNGFTSSKRNDMLLPVSNWPYPFFQISEADRLSYQHPLSQEHPLVPGASLVPESALY